MSSIFCSFDLTRSVIIDFKRGSITGTNASFESERNIRPITNSRHAYKSSLNIASNEGMFCSKTLNVFLSRFTSMLFNSFPELVVSDTVC